MKENSNWSKIVSYFLNHLLPGVITALFILLLTLWFTGINFVKDISFNKEKISEISEQTKEIFNRTIKIEEKYTAEDKNGISITVGINNDLKDYTAKIFKGSCEIEEMERIELTNPNSIFKPKITIAIIQAVEKDGSQSKADVFVNEKAIELLDLDKRNGIYNLKYKRIRITETYEDHSKSEIKL